MRSIDPTKKLSESPSSQFSLAQEAITDNLRHDSRISNTSCSEVSAILSALSNSQAPNLSEHMMNELSERRFIEATPSHELFLTHDQTKQLSEARESYERLDNQVSMLKKELLTKSLLVKELDTKSSGWSGLKLWLTLELTPVKEALVKAKQDVELLEQQVNEAIDQRSLCQLKLKELNQLEHALKEKRAGLIEVSSCDSFIRILERGTQNLKFMKAYGPSLDKIPYKTFELSSKALNLAIERNFDLMPIVESQLKDIGFHASIAKELSFAAPLYQGMTPMAERLRELAVGLERSGLPTKNLVEMLGILVQRKEPVDEMIAKLSLLYHEAINQGFFDSPATLQIVMPLLSHENEQRSPAERVKTLLNSSQKVEAVLERFELNPQIAPFIASQLCLSSYYEFRQERFASLLAHLIDVKLPLEPSTAFIAAQLSASSLPSDKLVPHVVESLNQVLSHWGFNKSLISPALSIALAPGLLSANLFIIDDMYERLRQHGFSRNLLSKAIHLTRHIQGECIIESMATRDLARDASNQDNSDQSTHVVNSMDSLPISSHSIKPEDALFIWAPDIYLQHAYDLGILANQVDNSHLRSPSENYENSIATDLGSYQSIQFQSSDFSADMSGFDTTVVDFASGFESSSFGTDGFSSSGFESSSFDSGGSYDGGSSGYSGGYDGGGYSGGYDGGGGGYSGGSDGGG